jgi:hypothetical protein
LATGWGEGSQPLTADFLTRRRNQAGCPILVAVLLATGWGEGSRPLTADFLTRRRNQAPTARNILA